MTDTYTLTCKTGAGVWPAIWTLAKNGEQVEEGQLLPISRVIYNLIADRDTYRGSENATMTGNQFKQMLREYIAWRKTVDPTTAPLP